MQHVLFPRAGLGSLAVPISQCHSEKDSPSMDFFWPRGDSLYGILPVPSQKLWTGQESRLQDTHGHLGSHSRSGQGPQTMSISDSLAKLLLLCRLHLALCLPLKEGGRGGPSPGLAVFLAGVDRQCPWNGISRSSTQVAVKRDFVLSL